jgi:hypothetical protein
MELSRNNMINPGYTKNHNHKLAEKCRKALEKHYGGPVPTPKCVAR